MTRERDEEREEGRAEEREERAAKKREEEAAEESAVEELGMAVWRARLFAFLSRNSPPTGAMNGIPATQVVELGIRSRSSRP